MNVCVVCLQKVHSLVKDLSLVNTTLYTQVEDLKTRYNAQQVMKWLSLKLISSIICYLLFVK